MEQARNFKFLNRPPMILGFEFFDCVLAVIISMLVFIISTSHFLALISGFAFVIIKSGYRKLYPKNTIYFWKNRKAGVGIKHLIKTQIIFGETSAPASASCVHTVFASAPVSCEHTSHPVNNPGDKK